MRRRRGGSQAVGGSQRHANRYDSGLLLWQTNVSKRVRKNLFIKFKKNKKLYIVEKQRKGETTPRGVSKKSVKKLLTFEFCFVILMEQLARRARKKLVKSCKK